MLKVADMIEMLRAHPVYCHLLKYPRKPEASSFDIPIDNSFDAFEGRGTNPVIVTVSQSCKGGWIVDRCALLVMPNNHYVQVSTIDCCTDPRVFHLEAVIRGEFAADSGTGTAARFTVEPLGLLKDLKDPPWADPYWTLYFM